jgi:hypothetical protein
MITQVGALVCVEDEKLQEGWIIIRLTGLA